MNKDFDEEREMRSLAEDRRRRRQGNDPETIGTIVVSEPGPPLICSAASWLFI